MRAVVQRVNHASVTVDGAVVSSIGPGLMCLIGIRDGDSEADVEFMARKLLNVRLWASEKKAWDLSCVQQGFEILCVSQFTLYGRLKGNSPDYSQSAKPHTARELYSALIEQLRRDYSSEKIKDGIFGAKMDVTLSNDGPVTLVIDSTKPSNGASDSNT